MVFKIVICLLVFYTKYTLYIKFYMHIKVNIQNFYCIFIRNIMILKGKSTLNLLKFYTGDMRLNTFQTVI